MPSNDRPHLILAADVDWPPYAYIGGGPAFDNEGIGADMARGMGKLCGIDITIVQTDWGESLVSKPYRLALHLCAPLPLPNATRQLLVRWHRAADTGPSVFA